MADEVIGTIIRDKGEIRAVKTVFKGEERLDIRYYYIDPKTEELRPSKSGISLKPDEVEQLAQIISDAWAAFNLSEV